MSFEKFMAKENNKTPVLDQWALESAQLCEVVGDCIHSWCRLEFRLMEVLAWALDTDVWRAQIVFSTVTGFAVKLDFISQLASKELQGQPELEYWKSLEQHLRTLSQARNVLAHHSPVTRPGTPMEDTSTWKTTISPSGFNRSDKVAKKRGYTLADARALCAAIKRTEDKLQGFRRHVKGEKADKRYQSALEPLVLPDELGERGTGAYWDAMLEEAAAAEQARGE